MQINRRTGLQQAGELRRIGTGTAPIRRLRRWAVFSVALLGLVVRVGLALHLWGVSTPTDTCAASGITASDGREGTCSRYDASFGGQSTFNVVDSGHALQMPEYDARLLASVIAPTTVFGPAVNATDYPNGRGLLVSFDVAITNREPIPLEFDQGGTDADLLIGTANPVDDFSRPQVPYPTGAPTPQLDQEGALPPGGTLRGWISFVAPIWAPQRLSSPGTDLELYRPNRQAYVGQIRLWKAANAAGRAAIQYQFVPAGPSTPTNG